MKKLPALLAAPAFAHAGAPAAELKVLSWHCERSNSGSYMILEGEVRNLTDAPISRLMAVARYHTKNDQFVRSDDALIAYNPIMPGQTSPFKIMSTYNPMTARCSLS